MTDPTLPSLQGNSVEPAHLPGVVNSAMIPRPFDTIPIEILCHILILTTRVLDPDQLVQYIARKTIAPFTTLNVCKHWREVVYTTPEIWTSAAIIPDPKWYPRLMEHATRCGGLSIHLDLIVCKLQALNEFEGLIDKLNQVTFDTHIRSVRIVGTPRDGVNYVCAIRLFERITVSPSKGIDRLELTLRDGQARWEGPGNVNPYVTQAIALGIIQYSQLRSLTLSSFNLPPWDTQVECNHVKELSCLDELYLRQCDIHTPQILWQWKMPKLRTLVIDCIPQTAISADTSLKRALVRPFEWLYLPNVRHVVLSNIHTSLDLQLLLSATPNTITLAFTSPQSDYPDLTDLFNHSLPYPPDNWLTSVAQLTILNTVPDMYKLRTFLEAKLPALRMVELDERVDVRLTDDLELIKDRVAVRCISKDGMELENVLGRMMQRGSLTEDALTKGAVDFKSLGV
ncbi:hypothetical protein FRB96_007409 [Tulasnella sp. 330]|nr:hypothetical protein FRB96_007409 [Tulasnella sp. 330]KAG8877731.1 hypothetical protein FRB97_003145 [Tulasnella sp. 331]